MNTNWVAKATKNWSNDIGTLCNGLSNDQQKINKWSLRKPVRSPDLKLSSDSDWLEQHFHKNGSGMKINLWEGLRSTASFITFLNSINQETEDSWSYLNPRGINYNEFYRFNEFVGYSGRFNRSYLNDNEGDVTYKIDVNGTVFRQNWDTYFLDNIINNNVLLMSDIWLDETSENNLGEYYLIIYVKDNISGRHFFKTLVKLSSQNNGSITITPSLEEIFTDETLLNENLFGVKDITRYYFLGNNADISAGWVEMADMYNGLSPIDYAPRTVQGKYKYLLNIFKNALSIPTTSYTKNCKKDTLITFSTETSILFENSYTIKRNLSIKIYNKVGEILYNVTDNLATEQIKSIILKELTSDNESKIVFEDCFETDYITWDVNNNLTIDNTYYPLEGTNTIEVYFIDIFSNILETDWNTTISKLILKDSSLL